MFLELFYFFLTLDSWLLALGSLFLLGHGLLYFIKILIDGACDFFSFQVSQETLFVNDQAHETLSRYLSWATALGISQNSFVYSLSSSIIGVIALVFLLLKDFYVDPISSIFVCLAVTQQCL